MSEIHLINEDLENLLSTYNSVTKDKVSGEYYLGGHDPLNDLSKKCWEISKKFDDLAAPAFVLHSIFKKIADDEYERKVTFEECEKLYDSLNKPIVDLIESMKAGLPHMEELNELVNKFSEIW